MSKKSVETYCSIGRYIEKVDQELYDLMQDVCVAELLSAKGNNGITFLYPQDKAWRKKFADLANSSELDKKPLAENMIRALILRDSFKTGRDWNSKKDNIPNSLFPYQHVAIKSANDKTVEFESGARAELDTSFIDDSRKKNLAVWKLVSGEIPITTDKPARVAARAKSSRGDGSKTGSYDPGDLETQTLRFHIARTVENEYARYELSKRELSDTKPQICFTKYSLSLVNYLITTDNHSILYDSVLPLLSFDKMDFYILVEPHTRYGPYLIDDDIIKSWWSDTGSRVFDAESVYKQILNMCSNPPSEYAEYAVYNDKDVLFSEIQKLRSSTLEIAIHKTRELSKHITELYARFESSNSLAHIQNVYPPGIAKYYANRPGLKLTHDELKYIVFNTCNNIEKDSQFDIGAFNQLMNIIGNELHADTAENRASQRLLINASNLQYQIRPTEQVSEIKMFVNSSMFLFIQHNPSTKSKEVINRPTPGSNKFFNIQRAITQEQIRILPEVSKDFKDQVLSWLKTLDPETLTPGDKETLRKMLEQ